MFFINKCLKLERLRTVLMDIMSCCIPFSLNHVRNLTNIKYIMVTEVNAIFLALRRKAPMGKNKANSAFVHCSMPKIYCVVIISHCLVSW